MTLLTFGELLIVFSTKANPLHLLYTTQRCCLLHLDKAKLFPENFSKDSYLDDSGISLLVFPSRTNLKLHNISVTAKMVKKVIMNLDLSNAPSPDCIPVVVLKSCEPGLSNVLVKLFHKCPNKSCFPECWKFSSVITVFMNVGESLLLKTTALLVLFLWLLKSFKNL